MAHISRELCEICGELVTILLFVRTLNQSNLNQLSGVASVLKTKLKSLCINGSSEVQPERLDALTDYMDSVNCLIGPREIGKKFIELSLNCFKCEWAGPFLITLNVEICRIHIDKMKEVVNKLDAYLTYKKILEAVSFIVNYYHKHVEDACLEKTSTIVLCLNQVKNNLPLFLTGIEKGCGLVQKYAANCLIECLIRIQKESCQKSNLRCSEFIDLMDSALNTLDELTGKPSEWIISYEEKIKALKTLTDELLCHSMSTAQVAATDDDKQNILRKAQMILRGMESLQDDLAGEDIPSVCLSGQSVSDALCALERAVNAAVLRLVMQFGSGTFDPLRELVAMCHPQTSEENTVMESASLPKTKRKASDLDELVMEFDAHMDRLMQIGSFAVSCSSNVTKAMQLRSCLASFESLEAELVPCVTALYLDSKRENKRNLRVFVDQWLKETATFRTILDTIVDPAAYTDMVLGYLKECLQEMNQNKKKSPGPIIEKMAKTSRTLIGVIQASIQQDCSGDSSEITQIGHHLTKAIEQCERLSVKLNCDPLCMSWVAVVTKARALEMAVEKLMEFLAQRVILLESCNNDSSKRIELPELPTSVLLPKANYYQLCPTEVETTQGSNPCLLTPHLAKGRLLSKGAVLYNTPKRSTIKRKIIEKTPVVRSTIKKSRVASVMRSRCFRSAAPTPKPGTNEPSDMELTTLLDNLTCLDNTFSMSKTLKSKKESNFQGRKLLDLFSGWDSLLEDNTDFLKSQDGTEGTALPGSTYGSNGVDTLERVKDLLIVEEKIENLKSQNQ